MFKKILTILFVSIFLIVFSHQSQAEVAGEWCMNIVENIKAKAKGVGTYKNTDYFSDIWNFGNNADNYFYIDGHHVGTWEITGDNFFIHVDEATINDIFKNTLQDEGFPEDTIVTIYKAQVSGKQKKDGSIGAKYNFQARIETSEITGKLNVKGKVTGIKISNSPDGVGYKIRGNTSYVTSEYFPSGQGDIWTYLYDGMDYGTLNVSGTETMNNVVASKIVDDNGDYKLMTSDNNGIKLYESYKVKSCGLGKMAFSPSLSYFPGILSIGKIHSSTSTFTYTECTGRPLTGTVSLEVTVVGIEDVNVPAGTFNDCLKFSIIRLLSAPIIKYSSIYEGTLWLAKDIGKVKEVGTRIVRENGVVIEADLDTDELTSATVGNISYP
jgi:hypothetical protein